MRSILSRWLLAATVAGCAAVLAQPTAPLAMPASAYIVQSHGTQSAVRIVRGVGGRITHELPFIHAVSAMSTPPQAAPPCPFLPSRPPSPPSSSPLTTP